MKQAQFFNNSLLSHYLNANKIHSYRWKILTSAYCHAGTVYTRGIHIETIKNRIHRNI